MTEKKRFISLKTKIIISTLIPVIASFILISSVIFSSLFNSMRETAESGFLQISQKYAVNFESQINNAMNYLTILSNTLELQVESGNTDRVALQEEVYRIFDSYGSIDGSSVYFEPDMYDGKDADYIGSEYGTASSGRICYYFYEDGEHTAYLPEALPNEEEFGLPHYTRAKQANKAICTEPVAHDINGRIIPMLTLTQPICNADGEFIGAVTVDLFLEDIYTQLQNEEIYRTGYVLIANDAFQLIYSPKFEEIGATFKETGINYTLPDDNASHVFFNSKSILNGKNTLVVLKSIYIPYLDSNFYISVAAPTAEINEHGTRLIFALIAFCILILTSITGLLYFLIGRISTPIKQLTESANIIAAGKMSDSSSFVLTGYNPLINDEVHILYLALKKMLLQLNEIQQIKLESLEYKLEKEKAEAAAQAKNDFLAKMSHEIRTPMNAVMGMIELILRKDLPPGVYENALIIKSAGTNLLSIINDILDFSKIESGMLEIIETDYLLPSLINDVLNTIRIRLIDKPVHFTADIDPALPFCLTGDEIRLRQILINLLSNAVKYTNEGFISLSVSGVNDGDSVMLTIDISDSGVGVKEEDMKKLFGDFVQIDIQKNKGIEGTGLGLAISRNLCRMMGGDITVRSEYGKGSTFTVTLSQAVKSYKPFAALGDPKSKPVLLYETRRHYMDSLVSTLEKLGVPYLCVDSIPALFENLEQYPYVFVSSFMYYSINPVLLKMANPPKLVLLADITETLAPRNAIKLTLPSHPLSVANILNDTFEQNSGGVPITGTSFIAPEARILIVDDITANLKVGEGLLLPYEAQITLCAGGREALELITSQQFDLVFMDHMMPVMDGLEVTALIRKMDGEYYRHLPIVALTANAVSGVREMFIQNGMNDFLSKPIETAKLDSILAKWLPKEKQKKSKPGGQTDSETRFVHNLRSLPQLAVDKALAVNGGSFKIYERIVKLTIKLLPDNIEKLNRLFETDLPNYSVEVHGMKSVLNNIGAYELGATAYELEEFSKCGDLESCKPIHLKLINGLKDLLEKATPLVLADESTDNKSIGETELLKTASLKLRQAADFYDSVLALEIMSPLREYSFGSAADIILAEMTSAFENFDFDAAVELINKLETFF